MTVIWTSSGAYYRTNCEKEEELEAAIIEVQVELFGENRLYLDYKAKIGTPGGQRNIPDGYLIDLSGSRPHLYIVENEIAKHHPVRHIAIQLLEFAIAFESERRLVQQRLFDALQSYPLAKTQCEQYAATHNLRSLDHLLDVLVHERDFTALVIIDEVPDKLENILATKLGFAVEVIELSTYKNLSGDCYYRFEPFLIDPSDQPQTPIVGEKATPPRINIDQIDTIVVAAHEDGFEDTFLAEDRWYAIRISGIARPLIKHIAVYRVAPTSKITHLAPVHSIEPWQETEKFVVNFSEKAKEIAPILPGTRLTHIQNIKYTTLQRLQAAKTLDDL